MTKKLEKTPGSPGAVQGVIDTSSILESISDGVFTVDSEWLVTSFNRAAEVITGIPREEALGRHCSDVFRASMCEANCALRHTLQTGEGVVNRAAFIINAEGKRIPISVSTALLRDEHGEIAGGAETFRDLSVVEELRKELRGRSQVGDIISRSASMRRVLQVLPRIAESESTILLQGETGTGKELVARAIHGLSSRRGGPFVAVNCGALPDTLLESELFGYKSGAFTGATKDKPGRFALARGGTLFLDEIGEISPALQVRLLRVLQEKRYEPLGATVTEEAKVRVITATNRDLCTLVERGTFRQDLYYRINIMKVELPPLRQRREDMPHLIQHFLSVYNAVQNKRISGVSRDVLGVLLAHDYPGNVRELQNIIEHAFVLLGEGQIELEHLPAELVPVVQSPRGGGSLSDSKRALEARALREALEHNHGNRLAAARDLGLHKSTLFRKVRRLGLDLPEQDGRSRRKLD
ncbi:MAG: Fis family transcriptional regulator [Deltaproteobacteria bacterium RIFOXYA12_FULL_61_11]|nr:MAG: Fis family transcriptional regulator [Deltaproteobacteria bacterium RIFOXYA12_FULL_61_11]